MSDEPDNDSNDEGKKTSTGPSHADIQAAVAARSRWEDRQATWYQMRHDGLRRANKPWKNAADMHFPLADGIIEKLKPYYIGQVFATETVASFVSLKTDYQQYQGAAGSWFDYQLKQRSNFETEICIAPDVMLQSGKCVMKIMWDASAKELAFEAINPLNVIVPPWTTRIEKADWIVHVLKYSKTAYKAIDGYKQDKDTLDKLCGDEATNQYEEQKNAREGITKPENDEQIIVWEIYYRDENRQWRVKTTSPASKDIVIRDEFGLPHNCGVFASKVPPPPFAEFNVEIKDRGYYSSRGVCERVATFEASLSKDWNTSKDYQTLTCSPMFYAKGGIPGGQNVRMVPGQVMPYEIQSVQFPPIPMDIAAGMQGTRQVAEQLMAVPDVGTGKGVDPSKNKTAAEVNLIGSIMGQSADARSRVFRGDLGRVLNIGWSIAAQYMSGEVTYYCNEELLQVDPSVFKGEYRIEPNGSGDNVNRGLVLQRAIARKQMFTGNPNINQKELDKSVLEADDPRLVKRLFVDTGTQAAEQQEDQASEISIMLLGFPPMVKPSDDDLSHIQSCAGFMQRREQSGEPLTLEFVTLMGQHVQAHADALKKKNPQSFAQSGQMIQALLAGLKQKAAQLQQAAKAQQMQQQQMQPPAHGGAQAPSNVIPMPPQGRPAPADLKSIAAASGLGAIAV